MKRRRRQRGAALLLALVVLVLVDTALVLLAAALTLRQREVQRAERDLRQLALADAALARALACLATQPGCGGVPAESFGGGTLAADIASTSPERWQVRAEGTWGGGRLVVEAQVAATTAGPVVVAWRRLPPSSP